jgi:hypothetical protein
MKTSIKIIKPGRAQMTDEAGAARPEKSVEESTREMVSTVKSWIADLQDRKRTQRESVAPLSVTASAAATERI